ncbi:hypothetical protein V2I01_40465 [Micromonospora sp. BRA006-A]|nr:hypothetical protein [Micromonospora sp. BRA006-A]
MATCSTGRCAVVRGRPEGATTGRCDTCGTTGPMAGYTSTRTPRAWSGAARLLRGDGCGWSGRRSRPGWICAAPRTSRCRLAAEQGFRAAP